MTHPQSPPLLTAEKSPSRPPLTRTHGHGTKHKEGKQDISNSHAQETGWKEYLCGIFPNKAKLWSRKTVEHPVNSSIMTLLTIFALFGDDIKLCTTDVKADQYFNYVTIFLIFMFTAEIVLTSIGKDDYFLGFFFWLDVIATLSLLTDITYVWDAIQSLSGGQAGDSKLARAGRAGRVGSRAGRVIRIIRIVRLIRIVKLYKHAVETSHIERQHSLVGVGPGETLYVQDPEVDKHTDVEKGGLLSDEGDGLELEPQSRVGKKLSELTTRRVIILVLVMILALQMFNTEQWTTTSNSGEYGLYTLTEYSRSAELDATFNATHQEAYDRSVIAYVEYHKKNGLFGLADYLFFVELPREVIYNELGGLEAPSEILGPDAVKDGVSIVDDLDKPEDLRSQEQDLYTASACYTDMQSPSLGMPAVPVEVCLSSTAVFDKRAQSQLSAALNMGRTMFICLVLALSAMFFSKDANELVLNPIERMIGKMEKIRENPLVAAKMGEEDFREEEEDDAQAKGRRGFLSLRGVPKKAASDPYETVILEKTIIKIGGLLALGFGEAGAEIIANNMKHSDGGLNAMVDGRKINAIFGFCDIRQFTDATEILREKVMVFVNQIAEIVHGIVDQFAGAANKNIGDAFLLVWKFPERDVGRGEKEQVDDPNVISKMADMSVMAFLKIIAAISKSSVLAEYRDNKELSERIPNYRVKMGFGLHVGWAIEGAIGSEFKVDASYLSPNVNMASRLEAATKQYGVPLLISGALHDILTPQTQTYCRQIDRVTVKGSKIPLKLYTVDVSTSRLKLDHTAAGQPRSKGKVRRLREAQKAKMWSHRFSVYTMFENDPDLIAMREHLSEQFLNTFRRGYINYEAGEWRVARDLFTRTQFMLGTEDGPSATLLHYMAEHRFQAPDHWEGYRELTEK